MCKALLFVILLWASGVCVGESIADSPTSTMVYRYWDWSLTDSRDDYQIAALTLALEKTRASHGSFKIIRVKKPLSSTRALRELQAGEIINLHAAPALVRTNSLTSVTEDVSVAVEVPLIGGLLGYRQLIVRKSDLPKFRQLTSADQLKKLIAGQGKNWEDVYIYRHNGYSINDDGDYLALTNMLVAQRFDYLPMSIIEVANVISSTENSSELAIVDNVMLYYPLPLYFYVSKKYPQLAERLEIGLKLAQSDGSLDKLLHAHFETQISYLKNEKPQLVYLENPSVAEHGNLSIPKFLNKLTTP